MSKRPTDDLEPSAKRGKRGSDRQITKDDPSDEEDNQPVVAGTFARASEDELKDRKVVKVRRGPKGGAPSTNPFAGVNLTSSDSNPFAGVSLLGAKPAASPANQAETSHLPSGESKAGTLSAPAPLPPANGAAISSSPSPAVTASAAPSDTASPAAASGNTSAAPSARGFSSFASSTASGFAATAGSASSFAFGTAAAPAASNSVPATSSDGAAAAPQGGSSIFGSGASNSSFSFGILPAAGTSEFPSMQSIFGTSGAAETPHVFGVGSTGTKPLVELSETDTKNGEEDEETAFHGEGKLFQFTQQMWRERGSGDMRIKISSTGQGRLVMRQRGNLKLLLNANLFPGMTHSVMDGGKGAMFQAMNYISAKEDAASPNSTPAAEPALTTFAFKSKQPGVIATFDSCIGSHKAALKAEGTHAQPAA